MAIQLFNKIIFQNIPLHRYKQENCLFVLIIEKIKMYTCI